MPTIFFLISLDILLVEEEEDLQKTDKGEEKTLFIPSKSLLMIFTTEKLLRLQSERVFCAPHVKEKGQNLRQLQPSATVVMELVSKWFYANLVLVWFNNFKPSVRNAMELARPLKKRTSVQLVKRERLSKREKFLTFISIKEWPTNKKSVFAGEGDQMPNVIPGDIHLVLQQKPHPIFKRDQEDLYMEKEITLLEALCGFVLHIEHLDK